MDATDVRKFIRSIDDLPTTQNLGNILTVLKDEDAAWEDLSRAVSFDQSLALRVLRIANSVFFGHSGQITNIPQSILFLGRERLKVIVLGMTMMTLFPPGNSFQMKNLWVHSYEVAFIASVLSENISMADSRECFLAGLLHDIGRIVFYAMDHEKFVRIETTDDMLDHERSVFGCTHAETGAWLLEQSGIPPEIVLTTRHHHNPSAARDRRELVSLISLAETLSRRFSPRIEDDGIWLSEHDAILLEFSLTEREIHCLGDALQASHEEIEQFFSTI